MCHTHFHPISNNNRLSLGIYNFHPSFPSIDPLFHSLNKGLNDCWLGHAVWLGSISQFFFFSFFVYLVKERHIFFFCQLNASIQFVIVFRFVFFFSCNKFKINHIIYNSWEPGIETRRESFTNGVGHGFSHFDSISTRYEKKK